MIPEDQLTPEIRAAYELVRANPGDPAAHLALSLAFWDAGLEAAAIEEFGVAVNTAGPDNRDFYQTAAEVYRGHQAWHLSAGMYLRLMPLYTRENGFVPEDVKDGFREAAYRGAEFSDLPLVMPFEHLAGFQSDFANVVRGRHALFNGELSRAEESLALVEKASDQIKEVHLLRAEIFIKKGNAPEARRVLTALLGDPGASKWMLVMAEEILKTLP
jgi:thioredoxin-like negative regulator of GroEL